MPPPPRRTGSPARPLALLAVVLVLLVAAAALTRTWTPRLGLDLRGGTSLTLQARAAQAGQQVTGTSLDQAVDIIRNRVNGSGVAEASVQRQGSNQIAVAVPGRSQGELRRLVGTTAELNFRQVLGFAQVSAQPQFSLTGTPTVPFPFAPPATATPSATPAASASAAAGSSASPQPSAAAGAGSAPPQATATPSPAGQPSVAQVIARSVSPQVPPAEISAFDSFGCASLKEPVTSTPTGYLITCNDARDQKFLLGPAFILGTDVATADAQLSQGANGTTTGGWEVNVSLKGGRARDILGQATSRLAALPQMVDAGGGAQAGAGAPGQGTSNFAIVLDGVVVSSPFVREAIPTGTASISGSFDATSARQLANVLKYGALPLSFDVAEANTTSPTLGGEQLRWGLIAGALGLLLTVGFALVYYRGLALVVVASLVVAGALTYLLVVLLGAQIGYALTLAGIAGLIVSVGITADSLPLPVHLLHASRAPQEPARLGASPHNAADRDESCPDGVRGRRRDLLRRSAGVASQPARRRSRHARGARLPLPEVRAGKHPRPARVAADGRATVG